MVSTVRSISCFCFSTHGAPRAQPFVKVGARAPVMPYGVGATELWTSPRRIIATELLLLRIFVNAN